MRIERWFWLPMFCVVSLMIHLTVVFVTRGMGLGGPVRMPEAPSIEVTFEAPTTPPGPKRPVPAVKPKHEIARTPRLAVHVQPAAVTPHHEVSHPVVRETHSRPVTAALPARVSHESPTPAREQRTSPVRRTSAPEVAATSTADPRPSTPRASQQSADTPKDDVAYPTAHNASLTDVARAAGGGGSVLHDRAANPLGDGMPNDAPETGIHTTLTSSARIKRNKRELALAAEGARRSTTTRSDQISADPPTHDVAYGAGGGGDPAADTGPHDSATTASVLHVNSENPLGDAIPNDLPGGGSVASAVPMPGIHRGGGGGGPNVGSGSPNGNNVRGRSGYYAPEAPGGSPNYGGGGGGTGLANAGPDPGSGGRGRMFHGRGNNPLGDGLPDDQPGIGPGSGGGANGGPGGTGHELAGLRRTGSPHLGAGGSHPELRGRGPGGGGGAPNRGPDKPGAAVVSLTTPGRVQIADDGAPVKHSGAKMASTGRMLRDAIGVPGRGALFELRPTNGTDEPVHIVYAMDTSGSMRDGAKILKAKEALKKALGELRSTDTFNIIAFTRETETFQDDAVPATPDNITYARNYVDDIKIGPGTNISGALDLALKMSGITHIMIMSDGEPNGGIEDFGKLRRYIRERNTRSIRITALALGLGEKFPGMKLLAAIADENGGTYDYINMAKIPKPQGTIK